MRKNAWLFLGGLILLSAAGALLRAIELRTALDSATMLMDFGLPSLLLLVLSALVLVILALLARKAAPQDFPRRYGSCFGGLLTLAAAVPALALAAAGALLCLRARSSGSELRIFLSVLGGLAALSGAAWLALGLDGWRKKKEDSFLSAVLPVFFCGFFLVVFYKTYAQKPALLYTLYPFLGLCAALGALHLIAGFTLERVRPRLTLFLCGAGCYLCVVALAGVPDAAYRLFLGAIALELAAHGTAMLLPHPAEPEKADADNAAEDAAPAEMPDAPAEETDAPAEESDVPSKPGDGA